MAGDAPEDVTGALEPFMGTLVPQIRLQGSLEVRRGLSGQHKGGLVSMLKGLFLLVAFPFLFMIWVAKCVMYTAAFVAGRGKR